MKSYFRWQYMFMQIYRQRCKTLKYFIFQEENTVKDLPLRTITAHPLLDTILRRLNLNLTQLQIFPETFSEKLLIP